VGDPLGGKSTAWKMLAAAQSTLCKSGVEGFQSVRFEMLIEMLTCPHIHIHIYIHTHIHIHTNI
jgi:hypothetical protein